MNARRSDIGRRSARHDIEATRRLRQERIKENNNLSKQMLRNLNCAECDTRCDGDT